MSHTIKILYDEGRGGSIRHIARQLGLSRNPARHYLRQDTASIDASEHAAPSCDKALDAHRRYIGHLLPTYPNISAVTVKPKLPAKLPGFDVNNRTVRRWDRS
ncbi:MAG: hypothetical protein GKR94_32240 [Gammaproteobacteria bacterium]|nr:hypothetical protein [Gammaproteobacteria bacterium]